MKLSMNSKKITACWSGRPLALGMSMVSASADGIRFWTTEEQTPRLARQQAMAKAFEEKTGISVEVIPVTEKDLGTRATAAFAAGDLPDVIYQSIAVCPAVGRSWYP